MFLEHLPEYLRKTIKSTMDTRDERFMYNFDIYASKVEMFSFMKGRYLPICHTTFEFVPDLKGLCAFYIHVNKIKVDKETVPRDLHQILNV